MIILFLGIVFYIPFLGDVHLFDWDEINFAESSREMYVSGDYFRVTVNFKPFWEKPPFFFWLQVISMKIFGVNEFAARFPNALIGILTLITLFFIGKKIKNSLFGLTWALIYLGSFLPFLYFKSGIIDPLFNYFIFLSLIFLIFSIEQPISKKQIFYAFVAGLINGLAILTKGPVGVLIVFLTFIIYWIVLFLKKRIHPMAFITFTFGAILSSSLWYLPELLNNGFWFFKEFIAYQIELFTQPVAGHKQPFYYHFVVVFIGCFPMSVIALPAFIKKYNFGQTWNMQLWMIILFSVVMILFTIVKTKIVHYSSMTYLPLSFLATLVLYSSIENKKKISKGIITGLGIMGMLFGILLAALPLFFYNKSKFTHLIKDPFAVAGIMQPISWNGSEFLIGILFIIGIIILINLFLRNKTLKGLILYTLFTGIVLTTYLKAVVPKIEMYIQAPAIEFYESLQGKDVYVTTIGFHSYAHLFYFRQPRYLDQELQTNKDWLIDGQIDKTAYFVTKNTEKYLGGFPDIIKIGEKGGFIFYKREPKN